MQNIGASRLNLAHTVTLNCQTRIGYWQKYQVGFSSRCGYIVQRAIEPGSGDVDQMDHRECQVAFRAVEGVAGFIGSGGGAAQDVADLDQGFFEGGVGWAGVELIIAVVSIDKATSYSLLNEKGGDFDTG